MPCQSNLNRQELKVSLPNLADRGTRNCHRSSRLCIAHVMSTVLSVYIRPVKTDSETRAGVHNDVSSLSVVKQSEEKQSPGVSLPHGWKSGQRQAEQKYLQIGKTKRADYIIHTNNPQKDRNRDPKWDKGKTGIQHMRKVAQIEKSKHWRQSPTSRLKHQGE